MNNQNFNIDQKVKFCIVYNDCLENKQYFINDLEVTANCYNFVKMKRLAKVNKKECDLKWLKFVNMPSLRLSTTI